MPSRHRIALGVGIFVLVGFILAIAVLGDTIVLKNGEKVTGRVIGRSEKATVIKLDSGQMKSIPAAEIEKVTKDSREADSAQPATTVTGAAGADAESKAVVLRQGGPIGRRAGVPSQTADWSQFLGAQRDNIAHDAKGLARSWPEGGPKVEWSVPLGPGFAGPVVYGDRVLLLDREGNERDVLRCMQLSDGKEIWKTPFNAPGSLDYNGSRTSPATDGEMVFTVGPFGQINAVRFSDGSKVWQKDLLKDWGAKSPGWGVSTSPLLIGNYVIVAPWGSKAALVAYEKKTGNVAWTTPNPGNVIQDYQSPVPMMLQGKLMIVSTGRQGHAIGVDAATGKQLWSYTGYPKKGWNIPSPIAAPGDRVLITGGYGAGSAMIKIEKQGNGYAARELWKNRNLGTKIPQAVIHKNMIYGNSADSGGGLRCLDLNGNVVWDSKKQGRAFEMGYFLLADGLIFIVSGNKGHLHMVEAAPEGYKELGRAKILGGQQIWAPMAYKDGKLLLRDQGKLVCVNLMP